ncbi:hypothetical protein [Oceanicoccus sagamiensis]|uniref:SnoaL-like domain-containing protein n=1 Tax=Oceanicoccus sagamiensis TaxID=716816 RepID=A0A1X9N4K7_9GAMM|nr:hypothetical protein [Oceanicoccus sagamiensis]ARN72686.1 hypothetical protein BST96_00290 [Oceanicoccus sagamiensis]
MSDNNLQRWHKVVFEQDMVLLQELLDDNVEFHSPTVWKPKLGRDVTAFILSNVIDLFEDFQYHREWTDGNEMALEFSAAVRGKNVKGVDLIRWNDEGKIIHFEVLVRPLNGLQALFEEMSDRVVAAGFA